LQIIAKTWQWFSFTKLSMLGASDVLVRNERETRTAARASLALRTGRPRSQP